MINLICTGGRDYNHSTKTIHILTLLCPKTVYVGDCPTGLDSFVKSYCEERSRIEEYLDSYRCPNLFSFKVFKARWDILGKSAGPIRNEEMINHADKTFLLLAFPGGIGTEDCKQKAIKRGIAVLEVK